MIRTMFVTYVTQLAWLIADRQIQLFHLLCICTFCSRSPHVFALSQICANRFHAAAAREKRAVTTA